MSEQGMVCVIGLGKLGGPIAASLAEKGFSVTGVDKNQNNVDAINQGLAPVWETNLQKFVSRNKERLSATSDHTTALSEASEIFITVPTPSMEGGAFSLEYVLNACTAVGKLIRDSNNTPLIVLVSTVMPGSTSGAIRKSLEKTSGKKLGVGFDLCYSPAFIALGSVIDNFLNPDFALIGETCSGSGKRLAKLYSKVFENDPPIIRMNSVNAEIVKLSLNSFITTKISFANTLARICEGLPGADVDIITETLGLDSRVGRRYLTGAVSFGGPCFPRDNQAFMALAESAGVSAHLAKATIATNADHTSALVSLSKQFVSTEGTVGILGLSYKPDTDVVTESAGIKVAEELLSEHIAVALYDPKALDNAKNLLGNTPRYCSDIHSCLEASDVVIIATAWPEFNGLVEVIHSLSQPPLALIDCWRMLSKKTIPESIHYIGLGTNVKKVKHRI